MAITMEEHIVLIVWIGGGNRENEKEKHSYQQRLIRL